jgi:adenylosuccinate lyase
MNTALLRRSAEMIARYSRPEMAWVWDDRHRYLVWLKVEMAVCEELAQQGMIPKKDWSELQKQVRALIKKGGVDPQKVEAHEAVTRHDIIAFTTAVAEEVGPVSRYIHFGLTSSDVVDTSLAIMAQESGQVLLQDVGHLLKTLKKLAEKYQNLPTIGRSHGIFAEPTSFGLKFLGWYTEWQRNEQRLKESLERLRYGKLSGAVGVNPHWGPDFEQKVLARVGLLREPVSTQVVPRDRHAEFFTTLALLGSSLERMAVELRHLQRSEVSEVIEGFKKGQKGSSAMPHKRNPISTENLTGCARLLRSYAQAALENVALWHERDISHSSVERVIFPDASLILDYAIHRMDSVLQNLTVRSDQVQKNLQAAGKTSFSGHYLLELVKTGATREQAYAWVQECALGALEGQGDFVDRIATHPEIQKRLTVEKIRQLGSIQHQLRNVKEIYTRALKEKRVSS